MAQWEPKVLQVGTVGEEDVSSSRIHCAVPWILIGLQESGFAGELIWEKEGDEGLV